MNCSPEQRTYSVYYEFLQPIFIGAHQKKLFGIYEIICLLYIKLAPARNELSILIVLLRVAECSSLMRFINF